MALIKTISTQFGINAEYWKIVDLNINWLQKNAHIAICGWQNKTVRDEGKQPITQRNFDWKENDFPFIDEEPQNERETAYIKIKQPIIDINGIDTNDLSGAIDA